MSGIELAGRYKIIKRLGSGGFGQTFLARDLQQADRRRCIIKQFHPDSEDQFVIRTGRRLFKAEAKVLARLGEYDRIPELYDNFEDNRDNFLVLQYVEGHNLDRELGRWKRWRESQVVEFLKDLLTTLAFIHKENVIHRDLKPENLIRRRSDGKVVLIDFGSVKPLLPHQATPPYQGSKTVVVGTTGYMPGEQSTGRPRFSSDVYAVGIMAIQALTGRNPAKGQIPEDPATGELQWRRYVDVSPELEQVIDYMVRYDYRQRFYSAIDALAAVQALPPAPLLTRRGALKLAVGLGGLALMGGGAAYYVNRQGWLGQGLPIVAPGPEQKTAEAPGQGSEDL
ncbi:serine/threonine-protein kinase [Prochlorothrix hollandica]|uniref:serine/threonine-protein kinase n=1 Tax=Prochlorothrix hollandica TaxID=1223 RepID=UPI00334222BE